MDAQPVDHQVEQKGISIAWCNGPAKVRLSLQKTPSASSHSSMREVVHRKCMPSFGAFQPSADQETRQQTPQEESRRPGSSRSVLAHMCRERFVVPAGESPAPVKVVPVCPRAVVRASRARAMAWTAAERTRRGQLLGRDRGGTVCLAMKVLFKNLEELSGQAWDNARERLDLPDIGTY